MSPYFGRANSEMVQNLFESWVFWVSVGRRTAGEEFLELIDHTNVQLLPRARVRQKVSQLTSFVEYFIVWLTHGL